MTQRLSRRDFAFASMAALAAPPSDFIIRARACGKRLVDECGMGRFGWRRSAGFSRAALFAVGLPRYVVWAT